MSTNTNLSIDTPGSLASTALITGVVLALALCLVITVYIITRRQRSKNLRAKRVGRRWINEVQYELRTLPLSSQAVGMNMPRIGRPGDVHFEERGRGEERGRRMERGFEEEGRRVWRSPSVARGWRRALRSPSVARGGRSAYGGSVFSQESELEIEMEGRVWYSRPVGGEYDDADVDSLGRVEWRGFGLGGRWGGWERDEEASVGRGSFVTAMEG